jgi:hypothetical protein
VNVTPILAPPAVPGIVAYRASDESRYRTGPPPPRTHASDDDAAPARTRVDLVLYVSQGSPACAKAVATLRALLSESPGRRIRLTVLDVAEHIEAATRDRILFTPTLLCGTRTRPPHVRVLGDLTNRHVLFDVLEMATLGIK